MFFSCKYSSVDQAIDKPSDVEVPLPISSKITKDFSVAWFRIVAVSNISIINVEWPCDKSSEAPILEKTLSTIPIFASFAGT